MLTLSFCGGWGGWGGLQSHFHVLPNQGYVRLRLSWGLGFDNTCLTVEFLYPSFTAWYGHAKFCVGMAKDLTLHRWEVKTRQGFLVNKTLTYLKLNTMLQ